MFDVTCIEAEGDFLALKDEWDELWAHSFSPSEFLKHSWFEYCWPELKPSNRLRILVVRQGGEPIAIAPLMKRRVSLRGLPVNQVTFILHPETQVADVLLRESEASADALRVMIRHLFGERSWDWQSIVLDKVPAESKVLRSLIGTAGFSSVAYELQRPHLVPVISLRGKWEAYMQSRTPRFRKTLRNVANRIRRLGVVEVKRYALWPEIGAALEKLFLVSQSSWKVEEGVALTSSAGRQMFFENLARESHNGGGLQIWILEANGTPIASETQLRDGTTIYALRSDFDQRYADFSPGSYLQMEILKHLFGGEFQKYSFGVGKNPYKLHWTGEEEALSRLQFFNRTLYGRFLRSVGQLNFAALKSCIGAQTK